MTTLELRKSIGRSPLRRGLLLILPVFVCFGLLPAARAVLPSPTPDGGYPGWNTAEGQHALINLGSGLWNTALGGQALFNDTSGNTNTAVGLNTMYFNMTGSWNTALGAQTAQSNTGSFNTALGAQALFNNTADLNTAVGYQALFSNTTGAYNTANGLQALFSNTAGINNTATGQRALFSNVGVALSIGPGFAGISGFANTANGVDALFSNTTGFSNTALGFSAGSSITTGFGNVCIGDSVFGVADESNITRIRNIGTTPYNTGLVVEVDSAGKLGYVVSSGRYKHDIKPMDKASEALFALKPVTFRYNGDIDPAHVKMFGLIAEDVDKVSPDLVVRNEKGEPDTLRFESINAMLLNEFLKEHRTVQELKSTVAKQEAIIAKQQKGFESKIARQQKQIEALTGGLQKVSDQLELSKPGPRTVSNNQ